jgi:hypothetical protein
MIRLSRARELCTAAEFRFVESCRGRALAKATEAQLREKIALARELRDKWWDAFTRQRRRAKQKQGFPASRGNVRSQQKSELFAEILDRVEAQLKRVAAPAKTIETAAAPKRAVKETANKPKGPSARAENMGGQHPSRRQWADAATKGDRIKYGQQAAGAAATRGRIKTAGPDTRIRAHVAARGKRSQARRDSKK